MKPIKEIDIIISKVLFNVSNSICLKLNDGRIFITPLKYFPEIKKLSEEQKKNTQSLMTELYYFQIWIQFII